MHSRIITPKPGERFAIQILSQCLAHRLKDTELEVPTMALRSSLDNFEIYHLYDRIDGKDFEVEPLFHDPLPGTNGRGLNILFTSKPVKVYYRNKSTVPKFTSGNKSNEEMLKEIIKAYQNCPYHQKKKEVIL